MRRGTALSLVVALASPCAWAAPHASRAACTGPRIEVKGALSERQEWSEAVEAARQRVAELADVDACAVLEVTEKSSKVALRVRASDGRSAERELARPQDLGTTAVALLVLPPSRLNADADGLTSVAIAGSESSLVEPRPAENEAKPPAKAAPRPPTTAQRKSEPERASERSRSPSAPSSPDAFGAGLGGTGRSIGALKGAGASGLLNLRTGSWLFGLAASGASLHSEDPKDGISSAARFTASLTFGHRFRLGALDLDAGIAAPGIAYDRLAYSQSSVVPSTGGTEPPEMEPDMEPEPDSDDVPPSGTTTVTQHLSANVFSLQAGAFLRASLEVAGPLRAFLSLEGNRSLFSFGASNPTAPELSAYDLGGSFGVLWSPR